MLCNFYVYFEVHVLQDSVERCRAKVTHEMVLGKTHLVQIFFSRTNMHDLYQLRGSVQSMKTVHDFSKIM